MEIQLEDNKQFFESILESFFNKKEIKEFSKKVISTKRISSEKRTVTSTEKRQIGLEIDDNVKINLQADLLITFAKSHLDKNKFIELLFLLGRYVITSGEFSIAIYIYEKVINEIGNDKALLNLSASATLALGEIFTGWPTGN